MPQARRVFTVLLTATATLAAGAGPAVGQPAKPAVPAPPPAQLSNEELLRNLQCMEQRLRALEGRLKIQAESGPPESAEVLQPLPTRIVRVPKRAEIPADADEAKPAAGVPGESAKSDKLPGKPPAGAPGIPSATAEPSTGKPSAAAATAGTDPCAPSPKSAQ